jgi:hypothetical protein
MRDNVDVFVMLFHKYSDDDNEPLPVNNKSCVHLRMSYLLTGCFSALRRKKSLQLSHVITPKLRPVADEPQMTQVHEIFCAFF